VRIRTALIRHAGSASDDGTACELSFVDEREFADVVPSSCRVVAEPDQDAAVFRLRGELDAATAGEVRVQLAAAVGEHSVVLDLTEVSLIDTAGVGALREVMRCIHERGGLVALVRPWRSAASVLELCRVSPGARRQRRLRLRCPLFGRRPHVAQRPQEPP